MSEESIGDRFQRLQDELDEHVHALARLIEYTTRRKVELKSSLPALSGWQQALIALSERTADPNDKAQLLQIVEQMGAQLRGEGAGPPPFKNQPSSARGEGVGPPPFKNDSGSR
ncbi:MAG: hypothetical protein MUC86_10690 [Burkholderiaceae bacterium]|jgi:hypothetical protein|nr:hypothetical protein [Burkholderiaceae bacterium]